MDNWAAQQSQQTQPSNSIQDPKQVGSFLCSSWVVFGCLGWSSRNELGVGGSARGPIPLNDLARVRSGLSQPSVLWAKRAACYPALGLWMALRERGMVFNRFLEPDVDRPCPGIHTRCSVHVLLRDTFAHPTFFLLCLGIFPERCLVDSVVRTSSNRSISPSGEG